MAWFKNNSAAPALRPDDLAYVSLQRAATVVEPVRAASWAIYLMLAALAAAIAWAALARVEMITRGDARVIPEGREQVIASLEGGILRELLVREGDAVKAGQPLALLDPTRVEAVQAEGQARRLALRAAIARATAESTGQPLRFDAELKEAKDARGPVAAETASFQTRQKALQEAVAITQRSLGLLEKELAVAESMSAKGLMSEVEVMRVRRQVNDLNLQVQERLNRHRQDASVELARLQTELAQLDENQVVRDDAVKRTTLVSPVNGLVKQIRTHTVGGVVGGGAPLMEIVPVGDKVLVEMRVKPADIGFLRVGQTAEVKLSAYEFTVYGSLSGKVVTISPDALGDAERAQSPDGTWYRALVEADRSSLQAGGKPLVAIPGMTGTAEVNVGERTVLSYLLRPMLKAREAFQER
jgi:adhesin transport system membrane fusion protein